MLDEHWDELIEKIVELEKQNAELLDGLVFYTDINEKLLEALKLLWDTPAHDTLAINDAWDKASKAIAQAEEGGING